MTETGGADERGRKDEKDREREKERERDFEKERMRERMCVCERERERGKQGERERERKGEVRSRRPWARVYSNLQYADKSARKRAQAKTAGIYPERTPNSYALAASFKAMTSVRTALPPPPAAPAQAA